MTVCNVDRKRIRRRRVVQVLSWTGLFFAVLGFLNWFATAALNYGLLVMPSGIELPMGELESVGVDSEGRVYCGATALARVQVYDADREFLRGWNVDAGGGNFLLKVDDEDQVHVGTARGGSHYVFDTDGTLLSQETDPDYISTLEARSATDRWGSTYEIRHPHLFPHVVKRNPDGVVVARFSAAWYLWFVQGPLPAGLFIVFGFGFYALTKLVLAECWAIALPEPDGDRATDNSTRK